jgi:hypothetical protein
MMLVAILAPAAQAQTGTVTGQLLNDRGVPTAGVRVAAMPVPRGGETSGTLIGLTLTDTNGRYTLEMLEPGNYYVTAGRVDAPSYYPGVGTLSSAKSILVTAGASISGIDFKTVQPVTHIVSGRVVLQPGQKLPPNSRMMLDAASQQPAMISPDGTFEFTRVQPGQYTLRLSSDAFSAAMPVTVEGRVTGLEFRPPPVAVNGSVVMEGAGDAPNVFVSFVDTRQKLSVEVATQRSFVFFLPEGEYRVTAKRVPQGYGVKSLSAGDVDLGSRSLKLSSAEPVVAVTLTLKAAPLVAFTGRAVSQRGVLQPLRSIRMEGGEGVQPLQGTIQPDGSFAFDKVAPGEYTAAIVGAGLDEFKVKVSVPPEGRRDAQIVIPEIRQLSAKLGIETNVPAAARPVVTLRFVEAGGEMVPLVIDGSSGEAPLKFSLHKGQYQVTATIRESGTGSERTRVKTLSSGTVDLLRSPLNVGESVEEIQITIGR